MDGPVSESLFEVMKMVVMVIMVMVVEMRMKTMMMKMVAELLEGSHTVWMDLFQSLYSR